MTRRSRRASLVQDTASDERGEFGALLDLLAALAAGVDLGMRLADLQGDE